MNRLPLSLIANPRIRRFEDLRGARLGTSSLTEGTALYTMDVMRQKGLHYPGDYELAVVGVHPARWKALQEGTIDAAVQLLPLNFVAEDAGYTNLGEVSDFIPEILFTAFVVDNVAAQNRRNDIVQFLSGVVEGTRWAYDAANDDALLSITKELTQAEGKYAQMALDYMRAKKSFRRIFRFRTPRSRNRSSSCKKQVWPTIGWWRMLKRCLTTAIASPRCRRPHGMNLNCCISFRQTLSWTQERPFA